MWKYQHQHITKTPPSHYNILHSSKSNLFLFGNFSFRLQVTLLIRAYRLNITKNKILTFTSNSKKKAQETFNLILLLKVSQWRKKGFTCCIFLWVHCLLWRIHFFWSCVHWHCLWWCAHYFGLIYIVQGMKYRSLVCLLCWIEMRMMSWLIGRYHRMLLLLLLLLNHCHLLHRDFHGLYHQHKRFSHIWHGISKHFIAWKSSILKRSSFFASLSKISSLWDCDNIFSDAGVCCL